MQSGKHCLCPENKIKSTYVACLRYFKNAALSQRTKGALVSEFLTMSCQYGKLNSMLRNA
jgi:hypothetical protein